MRVLGLLVVGWLGFNVAVLAGAVIVAVVHRKDEVHPDLHDILDAVRERKS